MRQKLMLLLFLSVSVISGQTVFTVNDIDYTITGENTVTYSKFVADELPIHPMQYLQW